MKQFVERLRKQHVKSSPLTLGHTRENVLFGIILTIAAAGLVAYIPSMIACFYGRYFDTAVIDTLFYGWILFLLFSKKISYTQRTLGLIIPIWILSIYLVVRVGIYGAGYLWLFVVPILAGLLLGLVNGVRHQISGVMLICLP